MNLFKDQPSDCFYLSYIRCLIDCDCPSLAANKWPCDRKVLLRVIEVGVANAM